MKFVEYLDRYSKQETPLGDLARDVRRDRDFPDVQTEQELEAHLAAKNACAEAHSTARRAWRRFKKLGNAAE